MAKKNTQAKSHKIENKALAEGMRMLAFSNASGTHQDKRYRRARTRGAQLNRSMRDW